MPEALNRNSNRALFFKTLFMRASKTKNWPIYSFDELKRKNK